MILVIRANSIDSRYLDRCTICALHNIPSAWCNCILQLFLVVHFGIVGLVLGCMIPAAHLSALIPYSSIITVLFSGHVIDVPIDMASFTSWSYSKGMVVASLMLPSSSSSPMGRSVIVALSSVVKTSSNSSVSMANRCSCPVRSTMIRSLSLRGVISTVIVPSLSYVTFRSLSLVHTVLSVVLSLELVVATCSLSLPLEAMVDVVSELSSWVEFTELIANSMACCNSAKLCLLRPFITGGGRASFCCLPWLS